MIFRRLILVLALTGAACPALAKQEPASHDWVRFQVWSEDSVALYASYHPAPASRAPVALLLHDRGGEGKDLLDLAQGLQQSGIPVLTPDLRGEGQSVESRHGAVHPAGHWRAPERARLKKDIARILDFADAQETLAGREWVIVAVGESAGLALELLRSQARFERLALLSPRVEDDLPAAALGGPKQILILSCDEDEASSEQARLLYARLPARARRMDLLPCRARGARMLHWIKDLDKRLAEWAIGDD